MAGIKSILSNILYYSPLRWFLHLRSNSRILVCNYHRLYDKIIDTSFDEGVFAHSVNDFEKHLKWLKKNTKILTESELISIVNNNHAVSQMCSVVTFDDGYIDSYTRAYPILKKLCVPAIFFIPTSQIMTRQLGWWDIIAYLIKKSNKSCICYDNESFDLDKPEFVIRFFQKIMAVKPFQQTSDILGTLSNLCEVPLPDIQTQSNELMTWEQIYEVSQNGINIGSHSHSHIVMNTITSSEQKKEMITAKSIIESNIGKTVRTFAYPVGGYQHFSTDTMALASECGYEAAFSFNTGTNDSCNLSQYDIKRIEPPQNVAHLATIATVPRFFNNS